MLITGGCKNLGALIARQFAAEGAQLALHYNSSKTKAAADEIAAELDGKIYQADLTTAGNVRRLFQSVINDLGHPHIVINTVGMVLKKPLTDISECEYDQMFVVNSKSAFFITQEAAKTVQDGGKIINIVTSLLTVYTGEYTAYQGSKAPVEWFTKGLSKELISRGISVNAIAPGPMDTPFFYPQESDESVALFKIQAISGRLTKIEDIVPIVKLLCTDGAWINGESLNIRPPSIVHLLSRPDSLRKWWYGEPLRNIHINTLRASARSQAFFHNKKGPVIAALVRYCIPLSDRNICE